jgi:hypothetical protein
MLPQVSIVTRESVAREFDDIGPAACMDAITRELRSNNPELLDIVRKSSADFDDPAKIAAGFGMFYRLLAAQAGSGAAAKLSMLPRLTPECRDAVVRQIDAEGEEEFTRSAIERLEGENPELLQMAHTFALGHENYLRVMQGFGLIYIALAMQSSSDRAVLH